MNEYEKLSREELEVLAVEAVQPEFYYELLDTLEENTDEDLICIIEGI